MHRGNWTGGGRWPTVLICFAAQNIAMGVTFASFGPLLASTESHFGISRAVASTGMSAILIALAGLAPITGNLMRHVPVRTSMMAAAIAVAIGYAGLAVMVDFRFALLMYGLIGLGVSVLGILGPLTLISRWFDRDRARILGVVNLPIVLFVTPFVVGQLLPLLGRGAVLCGIALCFIAMLLLLGFIVERPAHATHQADASVPAGDRNNRVVEDASIQEPTPVYSMAQILRSPAFWLLSVGVGIMAGSGTGFVVHIVPFGVTHGLSPQSAVGLLSAYAAAGLAGNLIAGWLADALGPVPVLAFFALCQSVLWAVMPSVGQTQLIVICALLGICIVPITTLHGAATSLLFGSENASRALGMSYLVKLPFMFAFAPLLGLVYEIRGSYSSAFMLTAMISAFAAVCFVLMIVEAGRKARSLASARF